MLQRVIQSRWLLVAAVLFGLLLGVLAGTQLDRMVAPHDRVRAEWED